MQDMLKTIPQEISNDSEFLTIIWKDGKECKYNLLQLRKDCPCATCRGGHGPVDVRQTGHITEIKLLSWEKVGRYGLKITWSDFHSDGIYTLDGLRFACDNETTYPLD